MISRRDFMLATVSAPLLGGAKRALCAPDKLQDLIRSAPKARFWISTATKGAENCLRCHDAKDDLSDLHHHDKEVIVKCLLCARECTIAPGERGMCRARINVKGELRSLVYGRPMAIQIDPIEKKPFYHFLPGSDAFSLATSGCPLRCKFCQNWQLSQARPEDYSSKFISPETVARAAASRKVPVIAYTYNEPTVFFEYLTDIARAGRKEGRRSVMISCGFMNPDPLEELCGVLDAIKIDLKGLDEDFYHNVCHAELQPVLRTIRHIAKRKVHLEIVNLVVPTLNDSDRMFHRLSDWVMGELGPDAPIHFTRFHPDYQLKNLPPTPVATLERARRIALDKGIHYPYVGNVPGDPGNYTYCPVCGKIVIKRNGFFVEEIHLKDGHCKFCGAVIAGVWS